MYSFVVPTYRRPRQLGQCLRAIAELDFPRGRFEVVVVDDGSETSPEAVVTAFADRIDVRLILQRHAGPAAARNTGAAHARGEYLVFTDDDCAPVPDMLDALERHVAAEPRAGIGGRTINALRSDLFSVASQDMVDYLLRYHNANDTKASFFTTTNLTLPSDRFREMGGFDTSFPLAAGEDRELCERWVEHGFELSYAPDVIVHHAHDLGFFSFVEQHFHYGRGRFHLLDARRRRGSQARRFEAASFYFNLIGDPWSRERGRRAIALTSLNLLSQASYTAGYCWERVLHVGRPRPQPKSLGAER